MLFLHLLWWSYDFYLSICIFAMITLNSFSSRLPISAHIFGLLGFYSFPLSAACFSVFSFCLIYYNWYILSTGCKVIVTLTCGVCPQWVGRASALWRLSGCWDSCLCSCGCTQIFSLWKAVLIPVVCFTVPGLGMALDTMSANGQDCVFILLTVWHDASTAGACWLSGRVLSLCWDEDLWESSHLLMFQGIGSSLVVQCPEIRSPTSEVQF